MWVSEHTVILLVAQEATKKREGFLSVGILCEF